MEADFWHDRWRIGQTAFHEAEGNALMAEHIGALELAPEARVFVPLCGKSRDIAALRARGFHVVGAELSAQAVDALFEDLGAVPQCSTVGALEKRSLPGLDIFVGDIFDLTPETLGPVQAVYDRAALVALPQDMRQRYMDHMRRLAPVPYLLISFEYGQSLMGGPPFSVDAAEVAQLSNGTWVPHRLAQAPVSGGLKGHDAVDDVVWLLAPK